MNVLTKIIQKEQFYRRFFLLAPLPIPTQGPTRLPWHDGAVPADGEEGDLRDQQRHHPHRGQRGQAHQAGVRGRQGGGYYSNLLLQWVLDIMTTSGYGKK